MVGSSLRRLSWLGAFVALSLVLAACGGGDDDEPAGASTAGGATGEPEVRDITVSMLPLTHLAPFFLAEEEGFFEEAGFENVESQFAAGGAAIIPAIVSGEVEIGYSNYVSIFLARAQGLDLTIIGENDREADDHGVYALKNSGIAGPADLAGKQVAVNTLNNIGDLAIRAVLESEGVDPGSVNFVEIPFPEMQLALEREEVDAIWVVEPFKTIIEGGGQARLVLDLFSGPTEGFPVAGYVASSSFVEDNPNTVEAFTSSIARAVEALEQEPDRFAEIIQTYTELPEDLAKNLIMPDFPGGTDASQLQRIADLMVKYGFLDEPLNVSDFVLGS